MVSVLLLCLAQKQSIDIPSHLREAVALVETIRLEDTSYRHKAESVTWPSANTKAECRTDCSGFWNALIPHSYPAITRERLNSWIGAERPKAEDYWAAIQKENGFKLRNFVTEIMPGDFVAIKYEPGAENTGHTFLVEKAPEKSAATNPKISGTEQWIVGIIDVTSSSHGATDSRNGQSGLGRGPFRVYTSSDGTIQGYAWSLSAKTVYRPCTLRSLVAGQIQIDKIPSVTSFSTW